MDKLKKYMIILVIVIILIIAILLVLLKININNNENKSKNSDGDIGESIEITNKIEDVTDISDFKSVENCIQKYYNMINNESFDFYERDDEGTYKKINEENIRKMRLNLLSNEYIKNNNITTSNLYEFIKTTNEPYNVITLKMKKIVNTNIDKYLAQGICINSDNKVSDEFFIIVNVDDKNKTFSVEPILDKYNDINEIEFKNDNGNEEIKSNDYNEYIKEIYNNEEISENYFVLYKNLALAKPEILYNYMDDDYKKQRFGNEDNFLMYIENNKEEISNLRLTKYLVNNKVNGMQFVCKDQYDNVYIFDEINPMQFSFKLDNYTILTDNFKENYENANDEKKVQMDIDLFIQMINRHDYITSYKFISEGFKNNYFSTQNEFENYVKNKFFNFNKFEFEKIEKKGNNVYVCLVKLTDLTNENPEVREENIIIQINNNYDFKMSFEIK